MKELIQLFTQITLLRRGPQDLPASPLLLAVTVAGYFVVNFLVSALMPPVTGWPGHLAVDVVFQLVWYVLLLRLAGKSERTLQTTRLIHHLPAPCPKCDQVRLYRESGDDAVQCGQCGARWCEDDYRRLVHILAYEIQSHGGGKS